MGFILSKFLYMPPTPTYDLLTFPHHLIFIPFNPDIEITDTTATHIPALYLHRNNAKRMIVYCHGNASDLGSIYAEACYLSKYLQAHVCCVEYPGYGPFFPGTPNEQNIVATAMTVVEYIHIKMKCDLGAIVLYGRSLGTGVVTQVAHLLTTKYPNRTPAALMDKNAEVLSLAQIAAEKKKNGISGKSSSSGSGTTNGRSMSTATTTTTTSSQQPTLSITRPSTLIQPHIINGNAAITKAATTTNTPAPVQPSSFYDDNIPEDIQCETIDFDLLDVVPTRGRQGALVDSAPPPPSSRLNSVVSPPVSTSLAPNQQPSSSSSTPTPVQAPLSSPPSPPQPSLTSATDLIMGALKKGNTRIKVIESATPLCGMILHSPFTSIADVVRSAAYSSFLLKDCFRTKEHISYVTCPTLFIHGMKDKLIPYSHSQVLMGMSNGIKKRLHLCPNADHNDFEYVNDVVTPIKQFLGQYCHTKHTILEIEDVQTLNNTNNNGSNNDNNNDNTSSNDTIGNTTSNNNNNNSDNNNNNNDNNNNDKNDSTQPTPSNNLFLALKNRYGSNSTANTPQTSPQQTNHPQLLLPQDTLSMAPLTPLNLSSHPNNNNLSSPLSQPSPLLMPGSQSGAALSPRNESLFSPIGSQGSSMSKQSGGSSWKFNSSHMGNSRHKSKVFSLVGDTEAPAVFQAAPGDTTMPTLLSSQLSDELSIKDTDDSNTTYSNIQTKNMMKRQSTVLTVAALSSSVGLLHPSSSSSSHHNNNNILSSGGMPYHSPLISPRLAAIREPEECDDDDDDDDDDDESHDDGNDMSDHTSQSDDRDDKKQQQYSSRHRSNTISTTQSSCATTVTSTTLHASSTLVAPRESTSSRSILDISRIESPQASTIKSHNNQPAREGANTSLSLNNKSNNIPSQQSCGNSTNNNTSALTLSSPIAGTTTVFAPPAAPMKHSQSHSQLAPTTHIESYQQTSTHTITRSNQRHSTGANVHTLTLSDHSLDRFLQLYISESLYIIPEYVHNINNKWHITNPHLNSQLMRYYTALTDTSNTSSHQKPSTRKGTLITGGPNYTNKQYSPSLESNTYHGTSPHKYRGTTRNNNNNKRSNKQSNKHKRRNGHDKRKSKKNKSKVALGSTSDDDDDNNQNNSSMLTHFILSPAVIHKSQYKTKYPSLLVPVSTPSASSLPDNNQYPLTHVINTSYKTTPFDQSSNQLSNKDKHNTTNTSDDNTMIELYISNQLCLVPHQCSCYSHYNIHTPYNLESIQHDMVSNNNTNINNTDDKNTTITQSSLSSSSTSSPATIHQYCMSLHSPGVQRPSSQQQQPQHASSHTSSAACLISPTQIASGQNPPSVSTAQLHKIYPCERDHNATHRRHYHYHCGGTYSFNKHDINTTSHHCDKHNTDESHNNSNTLEASPLVYFESDSHLGDHNNTDNTNSYDDNEYTIGGIQSRLTVQPDITPLFATSGITTTETHQLSPRQTQYMPLFIDSNTDSQHDDNGIDCSSYTSNGYDSFRLLPHKNQQHHHHQQQQPSQQQRQSTTTTNNNKSIQSIPEGTMPPLSYASPARTRQGRKQYKGILDSSNSDDDDDDDDDSNDDNTTTTNNNTYNDEHDEHVVVYSSSSSLLSSSSAHIQHSRNNNGNDDDDDSCDEKEEDCYTNNLWSRRPTVGYHDDDDDFFLNSRSSSISDSSDYQLDKTRRCTSSQKQQQHKSKDSIDKTSLSHENVDDDHKKTTASASSSLPLSSHHIGIDIDKSTLPIICCCCCCQCECSQYCHDAYTSSTSDNDDDNNDNNNNNNTVEYDDGMMGSSHRYTNNRGDYRYRRQSGAITTDDSEDQTTTTTTQDTISIDNHSLYTTTYNDDTTSLSSSLSHNNSHSPHHHQHDKRLFVPDYDIYNHYDDDNNNNNKRTTHNNKNSVLISPLLSAAVSDNQPPLSPVHYNNRIGSGGGGGNDDDGGPEQEQRQHLSLSEIRKSLSHEASEHYFNPIIQFSTVYNQYNQYDTNTSTTTSNNNNNANKLPFSTATTTATPTTATDVIHSKEASKRVSEAQDHNAMRRKLGLGQKKGSITQTLSSSSSSSSSASNPVLASSTLHQPLSPRHNTNTSIPSHNHTTTTNTTTTTTISATTTDDDDEWMLQSLSPRLHRTSVWDDVNDLHRQVASATSQLESQCNKNTIVEEDENEE